MGHSLQRYLKKQGTEMWCGSTVHCGNPELYDPTDKSADCRLINKSINKESLTSQSTNQQRKSVHIWFVVIHVKTLKKQAIETPKMSSCFFLPRCIHIRATRMYARHYDWHNQELLPTLCFYGPER